MKKRVSSSYLSFTSEKPSSLLGLGFSRNLRYDLQELLQQQQLNSNFQSAYGVTFYA